MGLSWTGLKNCRLLTTLRKKPLENIMGNGENQHFLLPTIISTHPKTNFPFSATFDLSSANAFNLDESKNLLIGKGLNCHW